MIYLRSFVLRNVSNNCKPTFIPSSDKWIKTESSFFEKMWVIFGSSNRRRGHNISLRFEIGELSELSPVLRDLLIQIESCYFWQQYGSVLFLLVVSDHLTLIWVGSFFVLLSPNLCSGFPISVSASFLFARCCLACLRCLSLFANFDKGNGNSGGVLELSILLYFCSISSTSSFNLAQTNLAVVWM